MTGAAAQGASAQSTHHVFAAIRMKAQPTVIKIRIFSLMMNGLKTDELRRTYTNVV